jgi:hypothetical protein
LAREPIEQHLRDLEPEPAGTHLLLRGSPLSVDKFAEHAARTARAYTYGDVPCLGISAELARSADDTSRLLQGRRLTTRHRVARIRVEDAVARGFVLLPTFSAPHYTVVIGRSPTATIESLAALAARDVIDNPYYQIRKEV